MPYGRSFLVSAFIYVLCAYSLSHVRLFVTPWAVAPEVPLSMGILQARILEWVLPGARVRNLAYGKGHEEGSQTYAKA